MKILMIIAPDNFRDEEYSIPKDIFEKSGFEVVTANTTGKEATGMLGAKVTPDRDLSNIDVKEFDAVVFIGGSGSSVYFDDGDVLTIAKDFNDSGKVVAAICIAPTILVNAAVLDDKKATSFPSEKDKIETVATYTGADVERDGKIITASGPPAAEKFGKTIVEALR